MPCLWNTGRPTCVLSKRINWLYIGHLHDICVDQTWITCRFVKHRSIQHIGQPILVEPFRNITNGSNMNRPIHKCWLAFPQCLNFSRHTVILFLIKCFELWPMRSIFVLKRTNLGLARIKISLFIINLITCSKTSIIFLCNKMFLDVYVCIET